MDSHKGNSPFWEFPPPVIYPHCLLLRPPEAFAHLNASLSHHSIKNFSILNKHSISLPLLVCFPEHLLPPNIINNSFSYSVSVCLSPCEVSAWGSPKACVCCWEIHIPAVLLRLAGTMWLVLANGVGAKVRLWMDTWKSAWSIYALDSQLIRQ